MTTDETAEQVPQIVPAVDDAPRVPLWRKAFNLLGVALFVIGLCASTVWLYTRNNDHPFWYHPDENTKAEQVLSNGLERNFNHPQLLLEATEIWVRWRQTPPDMQLIVQAGREMSALFGAMAVVGFAVAGYVGFGWRGMILAGVATMLCPSLLVYSHDMKEDASMEIGIGLLVGAAALYWRFPSPRVRWLTLPLLGAAAAIAPSGKYVGIMSVVMAVPVLFLAPGHRWWSVPLRFVVAGAFFVGTWALINHRAIERWDEFQYGLAMERQHAVTGHNGLTMDKPNGFIAYCLGVETRAHVKILAGAFVVALGVGWWMRGGRTWWREQGWQVLALWFALAWFAVLSMGTGPFHRYALPVIVLAHFIAGLSAAAVAGFLPKSWQRWSVTSALMVLFVGMQAPLCADMNHQYAEDGRSHLREWMATQAQPRALLSSDRYTLLFNAPDPRVPYGQSPYRVRLMGDSYNAVGGVGGYGSVDLLRAQGVRYVAVASTSYERFILPYVKGMPGREFAFADRREFYTTLFNKYPIAWQWKPKYPTYAFINPTLTVFELPPLSAEERQRYRQRQPAPPETENRKGWLDRLLGG